jgi:HNH endonuclease
MSGIARGNFSGDHQWRKLKTQFRADCARRRAPCTLGRHPIDYRLRHPHPDAFCADHIVPRSVRPDLALVYSNLQASCNRCNWSRKDSPINGPTDWVSPPW